MEVKEIESRMGVLSDNIDRIRDHASDERNKSKKDWFTMDEWSEVAKEDVKEYSKLSRELRLIQPFTLSKPPDYCDKMTLKYFIDCCEVGGFIDSDGFGNYGTDTQESDVSIYPSDLRYKFIRKDFTHIYWYNR